MTSIDTHPTVFEAWNSVMHDLRSLAKGDRNEHQKFFFRGIDAVMNACGPVFRAHGVAVIPTAVDHRGRDVQTSTGKPAREAIVTVTYTVYGPGGDSFSGQVAGEAMDNGDKATPKAMSIAMRTFLLQSLCLPTDEPEPDSQAYERSSQPTDAEVAQTTANGLAANTDLAAIERVRKWAEAKNLLGLTVTVPGTSNSATLGSLFDLRSKALGGGADEMERAQQAVEESLGATTTVTE